MGETTVSVNDSPPSIRAGTLHVLAASAWMSIVLGVLVECIVLVTRALAGAPAVMAQTAAEFAGSVTWSVIVCTGISLGSAAARHRERMMGFMGFLCAPLAWALAKGVQHGTLTLLDATPDKLGSLVIQVGLIKTIEYTLLALAAAALMRRQNATLPRCFLVGFGMGLVFGTAIVGVNIWHAPGRMMPIPRLLGLALNEIVFPIGCVTVLHFISRLNASEVAAPAHAAANPQ